MKLILHILLKDIRHLWLWIVAVLLLIAAHAVFDIRAVPTTNSEPTSDTFILHILDFLLPLGIAFLVAMLVFGEALPGDRHFWLTRPYSRPALLGAKIAFLLLVLNLPLFLSDCYILAAQSLLSFHDLPALLKRQLYLTILFVLPSFVLAVVTSGLAQFVLGWFVVVVGVICQSIVASHLSHTDSVDTRSLYLPCSAMILTACAVVIWQYAQRRTSVGRVILLAGVVMLPPVLEQARWFSFLRSQNVGPPPAFGPNNIAAGYNLDSNNPPPPRPQDLYSAEQILRIPMTVTGLPPHTLLRGSAKITVTIGGLKWPFKSAILFGGAERIDGHYWQRITFPRSKQYQLPNRPVELTTSFDFEVVKDTVQTRVPVGTPTFFVPGVGLCHTFTTISDNKATDFFCRAGLTSSVETDVMVEPNVGLAPVGISNVPDVPWGLSPATDSQHARSGDDEGQHGATYAFIPRHKIAAFQQTLQLRNVDLTKFLIAQAHSNGTS